MKNFMGKLGVARSGTGPVVKAGVYHTLIKSTKRRKKGRTKVAPE